MALSRDDQLIAALRNGTLKPSSPWYKAAQDALRRRQDAASTARYDRSSQTVDTYTGTAASAGGGTFGGTSGNGSSGSGSSASSAISAAEARARTAANKAAKSAANQQKTALQQAIDAAASQKQTNTAKIDALKTLTEGGFAEARKTKLGDVTSDLRLLIDQAMQSYTATLTDLNSSLASNDKAEADSSFANLVNRARETQDAVTQALSQGAGESDVLKTQLQALRNWNSNQGDINRSFFDTRASVNSTITDLNVGTKSTMTGYEMDANQRRSQIWDDFYSAMSDTYTQLDNLASNNYLLDQEIEANRELMKGQDDLLAWLKSGKNYEDYVAKTTATGKTTKKGAYTGFAQQAAEWAQKTWDSPGVSDETKNWQGQETTAGALNSSNPWNLQSSSSDRGAAARRKPEGATLRRW